jgi:branched-chain amino acid transport system permease protein
MKPATLNGQTLSFLFVILVLATIPFLKPPEYFLSVIILFLVYAILASSWNLVGGFGGQINLGHAAFFGVGAYGAAMAAQAQMGFPISIVIGASSASLFALVAVPTFRLKGEYFAVGTLGLSEFARIILLNWQWVGGAGGMRVVAPKGYGIISNYYLALGVSVFQLVTLIIILKTRLGLALRAIRSDEFASTSLGLNVLKYKTYSLCVSAFFAGLAGAVYAFQILFLEPNSVFSVLWTAVPLVMVVVGGKGTTFGPFLGAGLIFVVNQLLAPLGEMNSIVAASIMIALVLFFKRGLVST